jgi:hypothetical protein
MATSAQIQMLRTLDPGVVIPGIDTPTGNPLPTSQLQSYTTLTTNQNAPVYYNGHNVVVKGNNVVLNGYNFSGADVVVYGNNCTIENCTFNDQGPGYDTVVQESPASGMTVENCTFNGGDDAPLANFVDSVSGYATITDNSFTGTPQHTIQLADGVVSGNYISGGGCVPGTHADAINVYDTTGPVLITNNFVDWTETANPGTLNFAVYVSTNSGNISNVAVTDNILFGGRSTVSASPAPITWLNPGATGALGAMGTLSDINISSNYIGFGVVGAFYPLGAGVTASNNTIVDYSNPIWSQEGWNAYSASLGTTNLIVATSSGERITAPASATTTLYSGGFQSVYMNGSTSETVFVDGHYMYGGPGANIFKYLTVADSYASSSVDAITTFDPAKDVIDLSSIDANTGLYSAAPTANFTLIGTAPFSGAGGQVRYEYDAAYNETLVEADVVGDSSPDLEIRLMGDIHLTAANFALTAAQSAADLADGAALDVSTTRVGAGAEYSYTNVLGESYSSFQAFYTNGLTDVADNLNVSASANQLDLHASNLTISRGAGTESLTSGSIAFPLAYEPNETIQIGTAGSEAFDFGANFGNETIEGFATTGANSDTIQFAASSFSYLTPGMSQAQDLAAVLSHASSGTAGTTITDSAGDSLTLAGVTPAMISANPVQFHLVATPTEIAINGMTTLAEVANQFELNPAGGGTGPLIQLNGAAVTAGQFALPWTPVGAVQTLSGYEVAWAVPGQNEYVVWDTDGAGAYTSAATGILSGASPELEGLEANFGETFAGAGAEATPTTIATNGATTLDVVGNLFELDPAGGGTGPLLHLNGGAVTAGQFALPWAPVGAVQTSNGYEVTWSVPGQNEYVVWDVDSNGAYTSAATGILSGASPELEGVEANFRETFPGAGTMATPTAIATNGATILAEIGDLFELNPAGGGTGPLLQLNGSLVTAGEFALPWTPVGAVKTASGYEVAWSLPGQDEYTVWNVNSNGAFTGDATGIVSGQDFALEDLDPTFGENVNGAPSLSTILQTATTGASGAVDLSSQTQNATIDMGDNTASASGPGLDVSSPTSSPSFNGTPFAIALNSNADEIVEYGLAPSSGIETVTNFVLGQDELNISLYGAPDTALQFTDMTVGGDHAVGIYSLADPAHGVVLLDLPSNDTAAVLKADTTFAGPVTQGHALII